MTAIILGAIIFGFIYQYFALQNAHYEFTATKGGKAIQIQSIAWDSNANKVVVYVQNVGDSGVTLSSIYINGELDNSAIISSKDLSEGQTSVITLSETYMSAPTQITVKVVTEDGTFIESTKTFG
jgi:hypoxanthine phosphoribosyltransferase